MKHDITFRGKCKGGTDHWVYGSLLNKEGALFIVEKCRATDGYHNSYSIIKETVGQSICVKDKNLKDIYEGDIVLYNVSTADPYIVKGVIEFQDGNFVFRGGGYCITIHSNYTNDKREVIGNIHDNKGVLYEA